MSDLNITDAVTEAYEAAEAKTEAPAPVVEVAPVVTAEPVAAAKPEIEPETKPAVKRADGRDEKGRFAGDGKTPEVKPAEVAPVVEAAPALKPPQSWKPATREKFAALPPEIQQEILRREGETTKTMQEAAAPRQFQQQWKEAIAPFEPMIRSTMGGDPVKAAANMFRFAEQMNTAPEPHRAALVASLMQAHGVTVESLANALNGAGGQAQQAQQQAPVDINAAVQRALDQQISGARAKAMQASIADFAKDKEFFADVKEDMALILERDSAKGVATSLDAAYARACKMNPDVAGVYEQREAGKRAATAQAATQRAVAASSSVKPSPAVPVVQGKRAQTDHDAVRAAYDSLAAR